MITGIASAAGNFFFPHFEHHQQLLIHSYQCERLIGIDENGTLAARETENMSFLYFHLIECKVGSLHPKTQKVGVYFSFH